MQGQNWVLRYLPQSLPQIPVATTRNKPASGGISGSGSSRNSVWRGLVITAARVDFALIRCPVRPPPFFRHKILKVLRNLHFQYSARSDFFTREQVLAGQRQSPPGVDRDVD